MLVPFLHGVCPALHQPVKNPAGTAGLSLDATEDHMEGQTAASDDDKEQDTAEQRRERRRLIRQFLIDWSPVAAGVANLVVQHFSS